MAYKQKTKHFTFPVLGYGDTILPETELAKWQLVENLFMACLRGEKTAIFCEGDLILRRDRENGLIYAKMESVGNGIICNGIAAGRYFEAKSPIIWGPLHENGFYYLYISTTTDTVTDYSKFNAYVSNTRSPSGNVVLIATIDMRNETYLIDRYPEGKNAPLALNRHIEDNTNPHGELLRQTNLVVENTIETQNIKADTIVAETLILGDKELRIGDSRIMKFTTMNNVTIIPGVNVLECGKNRSVVFVQSLNGGNNLEFLLGSLSNGKYDDNVIVVSNKSNSNIVTTLMVSYYQIS